MNKAEEIKKRVPVSEVIFRYGYVLNRSGFMRCPFHADDHTASLKVYPGDRGWCCFGCHKGGTAIDFVMEHDGVSFSAACKTIDSMFSLGLYRELSFSEYRKAESKKRRLEQIRNETESKELADKHCREVLGKYFRWLWLKPQKTKDMIFDLEYIDRVLSKEEPLLLDPIARVSALISKHIERGGSYSCVREIRPDDGTGTCS